MIVRPHTQYTWVLIHLLTHAAIAVQTQCPWYTVPDLLHRTCPRPIDDKISRASTSSPWTHNPYCLFSSKSTEKFCVYSASAFNENSGISIITTPETAASLVDAVQYPIAAWNERQHIAGAPQSKASPIPYEVKAIKGRGFGVVATRKIEQFDTVMVSFPAMIVDNEFFPPDGSKGPPETDELFQKALENLSDVRRFTTLAKSRGEETHVVEDVIRTNAFGLSLNGRGAKGLYPEIARMNHGCDPNVYARFTKKDLALRAIALRDIEAGDEILVSYIPLGIPSDLRAKSFANWGFNCTCSLCKASKKKRKESDWRRNRLPEIVNTMNDEKTHYYDLVDLTKEFVKIVEQENLLAKVGEYYQLFMKIYYSFGDYESALNYAKTALRYAEMFSDPEGGFCNSLRIDIESLGKIVAEQAAEDDDEDEED